MSSRPAHSSRFSSGKVDRTFQKGSIVFLAIVLLFGGGGSPATAMQMLLQIFAWGWIGFSVWIALRHRSLAPGAWPLLIATGAALAFVAVQMVPLPPAIWTALPGRELPADILSSIGRSDAWLPLTLNPDGTRYALLTTIPFVAVLITALLATDEERAKMVRVIIAIAVLSALLGMAQAAMPHTPALYIHKKTYFSLPSGIFANRNFQGLFLLLAILLAAGYLRSIDIRGHLCKRSKQSPRFAIFNLGAIALCAVMAAATISRFAAGMLLPILAISAFVAFKPNRRAVIVGAVVVAAIVALAWVTAMGFVGEIIKRFAEGGSRTFYWPDLAHAAMTYFPVGSGFGSFNGVYRSIESLDRLEPAYLNHAHNDYIEILIEAGAIGVVAIVAFALWFAVKAVGLWRARRDDPHIWLRRMAAVGIALIMIHSSVDYPLRNATMMATFAIFLALVFAGPAPERTSRTRDPATTSSFAKSLPAAIMGIFALLGVWVAGTSLAKALSERNLGAQALAIDPLSETASVVYANQLAIVDPRAAEALLIKALEDRPVDAEALRLLGAVQNASSEGSGDERFRLAGRLGWRDTPTQLWYIQKAIAANDLDTALARAEALASRDTARDEVAALLRTLSYDRRFRAGIVEALIRKPLWRPLFLTHQEVLDPRQLAVMADILRDLHGTAAPPTVDEARPVLLSLVRNGEAGRAYALHQQIFRKPGEENLLSDGDFERLDIGHLIESNASNFDWRVLSVGGSFAVIESGFADENRMLRARAADRREGRIAEQMVVLRPGAYELSYLMRSPSADAPELFSWRVVCANGVPVEFTSPSTPIKPDKWTRFSHQFEIRSGCEAHLIELRAESTDGRSDVNADYDKIALRRLTN